MKMLKLKLFLGWEQCGRVGNARFKTLHGQIDFEFGFHFIHLDFAISSNFHSLSIACRCIMIRQAMNHDVFTSNAG
jgi:hypothetical protein